MRITSWNFLHGQRLNPADSTSLAEVMAALNHDLIALQEVDSGLERSAHVNQIAEIAAAMDAPYFGFAPTIIGTPGFQWRTLRRDEQLVLTDKEKAAGNQYGIAIASKIPVKQWLRLELGKAWIGLPLLVANEKGRVAPLYVKDEPRVALAAVLENGWTVINIHLSFVPLVNLAQLFKVSRFAKQLEKKYQSKVLLVGDFNLPWGIPTKVTRWERVTQSLSYPSWKPAISFDYILRRENDLSTYREVIAPRVSISDHRPLTIEVSD